MTSPMEFAELYERHDATIYRVALRVIGNPADAEECGDDGETGQPQSPDDFREKV